MNYSGLMLDFGGVILKTPFEMHRAVENKLNLPENSLNWYGPFEPQSDLLWRKMQADEITEQDYWKQKSLDVGQLIGGKWSLRDYMNCCYHGFSEDQIIRIEATELLAKLKRNDISVGILTNEIEYFHGKDWMDNLAILKEVKYLIDGSRTKVLKPDPEAYEIAVRSSGFNKNEIIFIDDQIRNVNGARKIGLYGLHFDVTKPEESFRPALDLLGLS